jgi:general L-amino acid transport system ATP-binding protein
MVSEVLDIMVSLAVDGMTMLCVTHEMGFARQVANRVIFMDGGQIIEVNEPDAFFTSPQHKRARRFLRVQRSRSLDETISSRPSGSESKRIG